MFSWQSRMLLQPELVLEDVSQDHAHKLVEQVLVMVIQRL
jgi:hypothetical protein